MRRRSTMDNKYSGFKGALPLSAFLAAALLFSGAIVEGQENVPFTLRSTAFSDGARIPDRYTCTAQNVSPPLAWAGVPKGTLTLALIMDDPDAAAKPWVHWVMYGIDPKTKGLPEGVSISAIGALSGTNSFTLYGYGGPCPPVSAGNHHYIFTLYALSASPDLKEGATRVELLSAIEGITIAKAALTGLYSR
jgi:Raf kinase inhibitor-like YbhB/YbcL family protein